jgi:hypothetical protein
LVHDVSGFRGREPEFPDLVGGFAGEKLREIGRERSAGDILKKGVGIDSAFLKMLVARTTAYCA